MYTYNLKLKCLYQNINLTGRLKDAVVQMEKAADEVGLRLNEEKTKYMINTRNKVRFRNDKHLQVYNYEFE